MSNKLIFSGHETFHCKNSWLKKGFDFVQSDGKFSDAACTELGVGRNMVNSIRFWLKSYGVINAKTEDVTELGEFIFDETNGRDKYLEYEVSLWLLHYMLIINNFSSIYSIIFNDFRKLKPEFDKNNFLLHIEAIEWGINHNTLAKDFSVFLRTYHAKKGKDIEESFTGILSDLELIKEIKKKESTKFTLVNNKGNNIPIELILYTILENPSYGKSISFKSLYTDHNSVGNIFLLSKEQLENKLITLSEKFEDIVYSNDSGIKELQFKNNKPKSMDILSLCYA